MRGMNGLLKLIVVIVGENVQSVITINEAKNKTYHKPFLWFHFLFHGFIL